MNEPLPWLGRLAHDLRGPLTPLQTASYLLRSGQLDPSRQQELLELIERQTRRLGRMIDELDDWSRVHQHTLLVTREMCEPALLLDDAMGGATLAGQPRPIVVNDTGEARIQGDPMRLTQLLRALLEYAARKQAARLRMGIREGRIQIDVLEPGAASDLAQLALLLEQPLPDPLDQGLGLQLLIARAIAEAHAGTLRAESVPEGLRLRCELPLAD